VPVYSVSGVGVLLQDVRVGLVVPAWFGTAEILEVHPGGAPEETQARVRVTRPDGRQSDHDAQFAVGADDSLVLNVTELGSAGDVMARIRRVRDSLDPDAAHGNQ
jgi:hypothetical protein